MVVTWVSEAENSRAYGEWRLKTFRFKCVFITRAAEYTHNTI